MTSNPPRQIPTRDEVIVCRLYVARHDLTARQIAERLQVPVSTVNSRLQHARDRYKARGIQTGTKLRLRAALAADGLLGPEG